VRRMLRSGLAADILTVIGVAHTAEQQVVEIRIPPEVLKAQLLESSKHTLPEFMAFTGDGKRIFQKRGMSTGFIASLEASLKKKKALTREAGLRETVGAAKTADGGALDASLAAQYDFVFVEYWADWCSPCHAQRKAVADFLAGAPTMNVLWLHIEKDFTKLEGMTVTKK
jgi:hypothetical protein